MVVGEPDPPPLDTLKLIVVLLVLLALPEVALPEPFDVALPLVADCGLLLITVMLVVLLAPLLLAVPPKTICEMIGWLGIIVLVALVTELLARVAVLMRAAWTVGTIIPSIAMLAIGPALASRLAYGCVAAAFTCLGAKPLAI